MLSISLLLNHYGAIHCLVPFLTSIPSWSFSSLESLHCTHAISTSIRNLLLWELFLTFHSYHTTANLIDLPQTTQIEEIDPAYRNAFHIFNAIHSSMRQWGSSLNHNGMFFFPALIPAGTEFYHGPGESKPIEGMEWLAFEPEHAQQFAHRRFGRPPGGGPGDGRGPPPLHMRGDQRPVSDLGEQDDKKPPPPGPPEDGETGFLQTYL